MTTTLEVTVRSSDCDSMPDRAKAKVAAYLPSNYSVTRAWLRGDGTATVLVEGEDSAGWTAEGYVIPRLASGWYTAKIVKEAA